MTQPDQIATYFPTRLAAVMRWSDGEQAYRGAEVAARAGVGSVEITSGTPAAFETIARLRAEWGSSCHFGGGTITSAKLAEAAVRAGAEYLVTPYLVPEAADVARQSGVLLVMGASTPTEIARAMELGAGLVKVFPANPLGGPEYIRAIRGPMPEVPLWVSGMVGLGDVPEYLAAGVRVVGLTNDLFRPGLLREERWEEIAGLCRRALAEAAPLPV